MNKYKSDIIWLNNHFNPTECYVLNDVWYGIIQQGSTKTRDGYLDKYSVKKVSLKHCERAPDDGVWIKYPEPDYETLSGARLAILLNANEDLWTGDTGVNDQVHEP